ncbi:Cysteine protease atg4a [Haplosporangium sp. Z 27]|nr:Cysteine protease atg4a [Haplosporangium sp. Z 27]
MDLSFLSSDPAATPSKSPPRPIYNRSRSQHGLSTYDPSSMDGARTLSSSLSATRSFEDMYAGVVESASSETTPPEVALAGDGTVKGTGSSTSTRPSKQEGAIDRKHFSSTVSKISGRKNSHSRGDIEFWASLYAQHRVYTRRTTKTDLDSQIPNSSSSTSLLFSETPSALNSNYSNNQGVRAPIKIWQVLTKTEIDPIPDKRHRSKTKHENQTSFQFERLPIKAPSASTATATALSSNGRPFSIVFFFTIEASVAPTAKPKEKSKSKSKSKNSSPQVAATTLWYVETAYTRLTTLHEHMELMGDFLPNGASRSDGRDVTPIYIYETQKLNFEQPRDQDAAVVLDLKLQSPEGAVYAEFSYTFVKGSNLEESQLDRSRKVDITLKSSSRFSKSGRSKTTKSVFSRSERDSHSKNSKEDDLGSDDDYLVEKPDIRESALDVVAEEPDAGEHFMQATSQFFSKMGYESILHLTHAFMDSEDFAQKINISLSLLPSYWLYNSKVVQYIARDDRVRTKTAFPADDIWMLGVCYQFMQEFPQEEKAVDKLQNDAIEASTKAIHPLQQDSSPASDPVLVDAVLVEAPILSPILEPVPIPVATNNTLLTPVSTSQVTGELNSPKMNQTPSEQPKSSRRMSLSQSAVNPVQRSTPTSSISTHEAQSHSHPRSATTNTTSTLPEDDFNFKSELNSARTRTLSHSSTVPSKSPSTASGSNSKSTMANMATKLSNMSINPKTSQPIAKVETSQQDKSSLGGMVSAIGQEKDLAQEQPASPGRKLGRRRMTISEFFSRDNNSSSGNKRNSAGSNGGSSSNVTALKNIVGSGRTLSTSATPSESSSTKKKKSLILYEDRKTEQASLVQEAETLPTSPLSVNSQSNTDTPPSPLLQVNNQTGQSVTSNKSVQNQSVPELEPISPVSAPRQRERKRKTSNNLAGTSVSREALTISTPPPSESVHLSYDEGVILTPTPRSPQLIGRDLIPRLSSPSPLKSPLKSSTFAPKRQNSVPLSPTKSRTSKNKGSTASSSPSPPPSPSTSSPGSSIKRSWRSLSLSLASTAKSALPLGLASPSRPRSSLALDNQRKQATLGAGFGHEYDGDEFEYYSQDSNTNNTCLISLPPSVITAMSLQRPPPPWAAAAFKSLSPEQKVLRQFLMDFQSRLWFTYRKDLARIEPSFYTCDSGWGCMMRTGQSLLAQAFVQVLLGREWRVHLPQKHHSQRRYGEILDWFVDEPDRPYSIHRIAKAGLALDKRIGEWFGPSTVAHAIKNLSLLHADCPLGVLVPMDNNIRISSIVQAATLTQAQIQAQITPPKSITSWRPVLLLIPTRFGLEKLTEKYIPNLKQLFRMPQFMGIAGGRPGRSLYFVACQGDELYYYDPHFVKPRVTNEELDNCPAPSFHCPVVRSMDMMELDPSMLLGFLIQSPSELQDLRKKLLGPEINQSYPLLSIQNDYNLERAIAGDGDNISSDNDAAPESGALNNRRDEGVQVSPSSSDQFGNNNSEQRGKANEDTEDVFSIKSFDSDEEDEDVEGGDIHECEHGDEDDDDEAVLV